jgi:hypothetical protein
MISVARDAVTGLAALFGNFDPDIPKAIIGATDIAMREHLQPQAQAIPLLPRCDLWYSSNVNQSVAPSQLSSQLRSMDEGNVIDLEQPTPFRGAIPWVVGCFVAWIGG